MTTPEERAEQVWKMLAGGMGFGGQYAPRTPKDLAGDKPLALREIAAEIRAAVEAETDRCAKVAHEALQNLGADEGDADELAAAIRSRK